MCEELHFHLLQSAFNLLSWLLCVMLRGRLCSVLPQWPLRFRTFFLFSITYYYFALIQTTAWLSHHSHCPAKKLCCIRSILLEQACLKPASLSLCVSFTLSLPLIAFHCLSLSLSLRSSLLPLFATRCVTLSLVASLSLSLLVSRCLSLPQVASICLSLPLVASLCLLLPFFASHCFSLPLSASRCLFRKRMKAILFDNVLLAIVDREGLWWGSLKLALHEVSIAITVSGRVFTPCNECTEIDSRERLLEFLRDRSWVFSSE